jgi:aryl-alcohol dehydrogenase-like predicted oxidoreductase
MKYFMIDSIENNVSAVSLGLADIGAALTEQDSFRLLDAYLDLGGNFLDTARVYSDWVPGEWGRSERVLGAWLAARGCRDRVVVATKGAHPRLATMHTPRMSRAEVEEDLNLSLNALGIDTIDLYYLHRDDRAKPVAEILDVLEGFAKSGKIRRYTCSNWRADRMLEADKCAKAHGWKGFAANQIFWSMGSINSIGIPDDTCEAFNEEMRSVFASTGIVAAAYTSQAGGYFTKLDNGTAPSQSIYNTPGNQAVYRKAKEIAIRLGITITDITLSYLLSQPIPSYAVVGCKTMEQLRETMAAADKPHPSEVLKELEFVISGK